MATSTGARLPRDQMLATVYGQAVGDAIGLLTEFLGKEEIKEDYGEVKKHLELEHKALGADYHRSHWAEGDWTDDTDQMLLILQSLIDNNGVVRPEDFAERMKVWSKTGFPELGDHAGMGMGKTTTMVDAKPYFTTDPHKASLELYSSGKRVASNGAVMRTSILGVHKYWDMQAVVDNSRSICKCTHHDPRCQASCVAVSVAVSLMLTGDERYKKRSGKYRVKKLIQDSYQAAADVLETQDEKEELYKYMWVKKIETLNLEDVPTIGYTYKCLGAGFWALKQKDFRKAIQTIVLEGGDADTNAAVAGALLGCKLGLSAFPVSWYTKLKHKDWLDKQLEKYFELLERIRDQH